MKIKCQEHYENTVKYAKSIGDETLSKCIERLKQWEVNSNGRYEIELYTDFAPYSFGFAEVAKDGTRGVVGGLLYHGKPDRSFAVMIGGPFHGWSIHLKNRFAVCVERKKRRSTQNLITFYTFFAHILFPSAHSEISKIRKLKSVFDGLKINSRRFSAKIKD